jgi:hypothetical protein
MVLLIGCGRSGDSLTAVSGQVFYHGKPLPGGTIVFTPDPERGGSGPQAWAEIQADGRFQLATGSRLGASAGWHRVTIAGCKANHSGRLPARYRDPEQSGLRFEVKSDSANTCVLRLE